MLRHTHPHTHNKTHFYFSFLSFFQVLQPSPHSSIMAEPSTGWWKLTFLRRKKSQPKVLYEIPTELVSNAATSQPGSTSTTTTGSGAQQEDAARDDPFDARLGRIVDRTTASRGRHVKVSHSGRFKEKKKVRVTLAEKPDMFPSAGGTKDENQTARK